MELLMKEGMLDYGDYGPEDDDDQANEEAKGGDDGSQIHS